MRNSARTAAAGSVLLTVVAFTCTLSPGNATASPPTPLITKLSDLARAQAVEGGRISTPSGTDAVASAYSLPPGSASAWTDRRAASVLAVTGGTLTLRTAQGCTTREYRAGQAAVVPVGSYQIVNTDDETLEFAALFANLTRNSAKPLTASGTARTTCRSTGAAERRAVPADSEFARGTLVPIAAYGESLHARSSGGLTVEAGTDVLVSSYTFQPGFSSGWYTHMPAISIITKGTFSYYEAGDGGCVKTEEYAPGQAYTHVGGLHMGVNESDLPVEMLVVAVGLPHSGAGTMIPVVGNTLDAIDFTPLPPAECPRLK